MRDESDRDGLRVVVDVKRDAMASVVLSKLYKYTPLQTSFGINNVALVDGRPLTLNLKDLITLSSSSFALRSLSVRTRFELAKALSRAHILVGLLIALDYLDEVIALIRASATPEEAREGLMRGDFIDDKDAFWKKFKEPWSKKRKPKNFGCWRAMFCRKPRREAILDMRLQKLTGLERDKIRAEYQEIKALIDELRGILDSEEKQREIVKEELREVQAKYGDDRRSEISLEDGDISIEDLIKDEKVAITISHLGLYQTYTHH